jgi:hypothetical protein
MCDLLYDLSSKFVATDTSVAASVDTRKRATGRAPLRSEQEMRQWKRNREQPWSTGEITGLGMGLGMDALLESGGKSGRGSGKRKKVAGGSEEVEEIAWEDLPDEMKDACGYTNSMGYRVTSTVDPAHRVTSTVDPAHPVLASANRSGSVQSGSTTRSSEGGTSRSAWACEACTFVHEPGRGKPRLTCKMCGTARA